MEQPLLQYHSQQCVLSLGSCLICDVESNLLSDIPTSLLDNEYDINFDIDKTNKRKVNILDFITN